MKFWMGIACGVFLGGIVGMLTMAPARDRELGEGVVVCPPGVDPEHPWRCRSGNLNLDTLTQMGVLYAGRDADGIRHVILTDDQGRVILSPESEHTGLEFEEPRPTLSHPYSSDNIPAGPDTRVWTQRRRCKDVWVLEQP